MFGTGTLINTIAVIAGSGIGIFLHKGIKKNCRLLSCVPAELLPYS